MKNQLWKLCKVLMMIPCLVFLVNCSKSSKSNNNNNNQCYNQQYGQYNPNCNNNGGYYLSGNQCYNSQGQPVAYSYCQNNGSGYGQKCDGFYKYNNQSVCCGYACAQWYGQGTYGNCTGYTLQTQSGQTVTCQ